jgi:uncharacterized Zn finger protein
MIQIPGLSEALIRQHTSAETLMRGRGYARSGAVVAPAQRGDAFEAQVEGSGAQPYRVRVSFDTGGITSATCTCPFDGLGWCKHIVAALLVALERPEQVAERPPLSALLASLDRGQLQVLLERLAARGPELADAIEVELALSPPASSAPKTSPKPAAPARHTPVDPEPLRRQVRALLNPRGRDYGGYGYSATVASDMGQIIERMRGFLDAGDAANALHLLDAVTDEYMESWYELDEEGELGDILDDLGDLWAEALLSPGASDEEREAWAHRLSEWADEADEYGSGDGLRMAERAALQGWDDPAIVAALRSAQPLPATLGSRTPADEEDDEGYEDEPYDDEDGDEDDEGIYRGGYAGAGLPTPAERLLAIRLRVLERQGRSDEYLNLATAAGMARERALMLVRLGRTDEAVAVCQADLASARDALAVATALRERRELDAALRVGARGLRLAEPRAELGSWLATLAASLDHEALALEAAEVAFRSEPSLARFLMLRDLAGAGWEKLRGKLLALLRDAAAAWRSRSAAIDIFLYEGLLDDAIKAVGDSGYSGHMARVMDAAITQRPDWVIDAAIRQAAQIIDPGKAQHYDDAINWLRRARASYRASGRAGDWALYLKQLRETHGRKYKLMGLIERLEAER